MSGLKVVGSIAPHTFDQDRSRALHTESGDIRRSLRTRLRGYRMAPSGEWSQAVAISNRKEHNMAEGTIKRLTDRGFGFIETSPGNDIFFHMSNVDGVRFEDLREGQKVSFNEGQGPKGPRAENVRPL